jgi:formylglycine-generating enzyme required for sulfatase activity
VQVAQVQVRERPVVSAPRVEAASYAVGQSFRDCGAGCPEMVVVPPGSFMMGSPDGEGDSDEHPRHTVSISYPLAVAKYEVTFSEWEACIADGGCGGYKPSDQAWGRGRRPVVNVSWTDAQTYVQWLSRKTGQSYRLLSESEWEYVARAGTITAFSTGDCINTSQANYDGNYDYKGCGAKTGVYRGKTLEVGSFAPNGFGVYDMHGNVWEWVSDCYQESYQGAPSDGVSRDSCTGSNAGMRLLRGGSWYNSPVRSRTAIRFRNTPSDRYFVIGFRMARRL